MKINAQWHLKNRMPKNPSFTQRMVWHIGHSRNCSCRPIPEKLRLEIEKFKKNKEENEEKKD